MKFENEDYRERLNTPLPVATALELTEERVSALALDSDDGEFLIVIGDLMSNYYVQFVLNEGRFMHCEAVSNEFLKDQAALDAMQMKQMADLGWESDTSSAHFSMEILITTPEQVGKDCADLARKTLLGPYRIPENNLWLIQDANSLQIDEEPVPESVPLPELSVEAALQSLEQLVIQYAKDDQFENSVRIVGDKEKLYEIGFYFGEVGSIYCQASSNEVLDPKYALDNSQVAKMEKSGWINDEKVHFWQSVSISTAEVTGKQCVELARDTLIGIFGISESASWSLDDGSAPYVPAQKQVRADLFTNAPQKTEQGWCITPGSDVSITLNCETQEMAVELARLFHSDEYHKTVSRHRLVETFMERRVSCLEIDTVLARYRKLFRELVESLPKINDDDLASAPRRMDREDFRKTAVVESMGLSQSFIRFLSLDARPDWRAANPEFAKVPLTVLRYYLVHYHEKFGHLFSEKQDTEGSLLTECVRHGLVSVGVDVPLDIILEKLKLQDINKALGTSITRRQAAVNVLWADPSPKLKLQSAIDLEQFNSPVVRFATAEADLFFADWSWNASVASIIFNTTHPQPDSPIWWASAKAENQELRVNSVKIQKRALKCYQKYDSERKARIARSRPSALDENPGRILTRVRPEDAVRFAHWNFWLGYLAKSKHASEPEYAEVIDAVAKKAIELLPVAREQLRAWHQRFQTDSGNNELVYPKGNEITGNDAFPRYIRYLESAGRLDDAIAVCTSCITYGIHDCTKGGFEQRLATLKKKIQVLSEKSGPPKKRGKVSSEDIAAILFQYPACSSKGRKSLAAKYGLTMSHLYYIMATNKS